MQLLKIVPVKRKWKEEYIGANPVGFPESGCPQNFGSGCLPWLGPSQKLSAKSTPGAE